MSGCDRKLLLVIYQGDKEKAITNGHLNINYYQKCAAGFPDDHGYHRSNTLQNQVYVVMIW